MRHAVPLLLLVAAVAGSGCMSDPAPAAAPSSPAPKKNETAPPELVFDGAVHLALDSDPPPVKFSALKNYTYLVFRVDLTRAQCHAMVANPQKPGSIRVEQPNGTFSMGLYGGNSFSGTCDGPSSVSLMGERQVQTKPGPWTISVEGRGVGYKLGFRVTGYWGEPPKDPYARPPGKGLEPVSSPI